MAESRSEHVLVDVRDGVATLTLNRADKRNSVTYAMWVAIGDALESLAQQPDVRALVVTGAGDHFCAGADISELSNGTGGTYGEANWRAEEALANFPAPTVAKIRGNCVGGGVSIATACDVRFADHTAVFGVTPAKLGIVYPTNALERLVTIVGPSAAKVMMFGAELFDAQRAHHIHLIDELHAADSLESRVEEYVRVLLERSHLTQVATKQMIHEVVRRGSVSPELKSAWADTPVSSGELAEGVDAFAQRRPPRFPWRRQ